MTQTYNDALEWAAQWIEDTLRNGPETNERTIEFGTNMAMTLRAAKLADLPRAAADDKAIQQALRPIRGCATDDQYVDVFERVTALVSTPRAETGLTVEAALAELRQMFPLQVKGNKHGRGIDVERNEFASSSLRGERSLSKVTIRIEYATGGYSAPLIVSADSLEQAMQEIRAWAQSRAEREGERT